MRRYFSRGRGGTQPRSQGSLRVGENPGNEVGDIQQNFVREALNNIPFLTEDVPFSYTIY